MVGVIVFIILKSLEVIGLVTILLSFREFLRRREKGCGKHSYDISNGYINVFKDKGDSSNKISYYPNQMMYYSGMQYYDRDERTDKQTRYAHYPNQMMYYQR